MSVDVMSMVFKRYPNGGGEMVLALALADHAHDDGTHIFPSVEKLAIKTRQSERTVQYQLRKMEKTGFLWLVANPNGGRGSPRVYRINPKWLKGAELAPFEEKTKAEKGAESAPIQNQKGCNSRQERVQSDAQKGATAIAPEPSVTIKEPSSGTASGPRQDHVFETLAEVCGIDWQQPMTKNERGRLNQAAKQLRTVEAQPDEIRRRAVAYRQKWPNAELTPQALINQWSQCLADPKLIQKPIDPERRRLQELETDAIGLWRMMLEPEGLERQPGESIPDWHNRVKIEWQEKHGLNREVQHD